MILPVDGDTAATADAGCSIDVQWLVIAYQREYEALRFFRDLDPLSAPKAKTLEPLPRHSDVGNDLLAMLVSVIGAADGCDKYLAFAAVATSPAWTPICKHNELLFCRSRVLGLVDHNCLRHQNG
jgi:hypothetical protein